MKSKYKILLALVFLAIGMLYFIAPRILIQIRGPFYSHQPTEQYPNTIKFQVHEGIDLSAGIYYTEKDTVKGTIILVHGIRAYKERFLSLSKFLGTQGYHTIAVDLRAHGESEGDYCTFGIKEKRDVINLLNQIEKNKRLKGRVGIWGQSLGGAVALQAMAEDKRIQFGIIESTFSDFESIVPDYFIYHLGFHIPWLTDFLVYRAGEIGGFDPSAANPGQSCKKIENKVLMVHGTDDRRISIDYGNANYENLSSEKKKFIAIEGANHLNVWSVGGAQYYHQVLAFIENDK